MYKLINIRTVEHYLFKDKNKKYKLVYMEGPVKFTKYYRNKNNLIKYVKKVEQDNCSYKIFVKEEGWYKMKFEENFLIESKDFYHHYCFDETGLYVSCYDKQKKKYLFDGYEIKSKTHQRFIHETLHEPNKTIKKSNMKFIVRRHDGYNTKIKNPDDMGDKPTMIEKILSIIKRRWVNGFRT